MAALSLYEYRGPRLISACTSCLCSPLMSAAVGYRRKLIALGALVWTQSNQSAGPINRQPQPVISSIPVPIKPLFSLGGLAFEALIWLDCPLFRAWRSRASWEVSMSYAAAAIRVVLSALIFRDWLSKDPTKSPKLKSCPGSFFSSSLITTCHKRRTTIRTTPILLTLWGRGRLCG